MCIRDSSKSESGTFKSDPFNLVPNPNDFLDKSIWNTTDDPLDDIRVNASNSESSTESNSLSCLLYTSGSGDISLLIYDREHFLVIIALCHCFYIRGGDYGINKEESP